MEVTSQQLVRKQDSQSNDPKGKNPSNIHWVNMEVDPTPGEILITVVLVGTLQIYKILNQRT